MKKLLTILLFAATGLSAQTDTAAVQVGEKDAPPVAKDSTSSTPAESNEVLTFVEEMPQFPGGQPAFDMYLRNNIRYPAVEKSKGQQGTVYISFIIGKDGNVDSVWTVKGVPDAPGLSKEAERVIREMPTWLPGKMNGKPVRVEMTIPIRFTLDSGRKKKKNR